LTFLLPLLSAKVLLELEIDKMRRITRRDISKIGVIWKKKSDREWAVMFRNDSEYWFHVGEHGMMRMNFDINDVTICNVM
jgi:hypothetical protein